MEIKMILRNINYESDLKREREKDKLEKERHETTKDIQMWLMLHPADFKHLNYLIGKLGKTNEKLRGLKPAIVNQSPHEDTVYEENGLLYTEIIRQEYTGNNCIISAGFVEGKNKPEVDKIYIRLEKDSVEPTILLLRPDEAQILAWVSSGVIWSYLMSLMNVEKGG